MKGWGSYELMRQQAEQRLAEQCPKPQPTPTWAPGCVEWHAERNKSS